MIRVKLQLEFTMRVRRGLRPDRDVGFVASCTPNNPYSSIKKIELSVGEEKYS
jgi:hypothetical protein